MMISQANDVLSPPAGFRKAIPTVLKLKIVLHQGARCTACGERLGELEDTQFDHVPALQLRAWDPDVQDTVPSANSPDHIEAKHRDCHKEKTFGSKGGGVRGDVQEIARTKRLHKNHREFMARLLSPNRDAEPEKPKRKHRWPKRPLRSRSSFNGSKVSRGQAGSRKLSTDQSD